MTSLLEQNENEQQDNPTAMRIARIIHEARKDEAVLRRYLEMKRLKRRLRSNQKGPPQKT